MKIMVVGDGHSNVHETVVVDAFRELGHQAEGFFWTAYFVSESIAVRNWLRVQNKFLIGPTIDRLNKDLPKRVLRLQPDIVFVYRGTHIYPETLCSIRKITSGRCVMIGYNNDDPFTSAYPKWMWRHFLRSIPEYDMVLAYRGGNVRELRDAGAKRVNLLRSWFVPGRNYPTELSAEEKEDYECDVVFVGHYEADGRTELLERVARRGWKLRLFGPGYDWDPKIWDSEELSSQVPVRLVWGEDYNRALNGAKIALCFLSKLNRDTYTRRCFEIPASGTLMLSEYTNDLARLFCEGKEAEYFRSADEMIDKIELYLRDEERRKAVAEAGHRRVHEAGHDVVTRMKTLLQWVDGIREQAV